MTSSPLIERLKALIAKQRDERGDMMTLGNADPEIAEAIGAMREDATLIRELVEALENLVNSIEAPRCRAIELVAALRAKATSND